MENTKKNQLNKNEHNKKDTKTVILTSGKTAHCISESNRKTSIVLCFTNFLLDTGAQSSLVAKSFLSTLRKKEVKKEHNLNLCSSKYDPIFTLGQLSIT